MSNKTKWVIVIAVVIGILTGTVTGSVLRGEPVNWKAVSFNMVLAFGGFYLLLFLRKDIKQEEKDAHTKRKKIKKNNIKQSQKTSAKWYKSISFWFIIFLGFVIIRFVSFLIFEGQIRTDDIWLRLLVISLGTLVAWWYVSKRD
ncbi:MAG: hypothetical protein PWQ67_1796 [Clostridia bacterium]|jgi:hypothetical protein|nr:hypothetical protein [Clostridia bacterium]MDN5323342.1 hypothetical protein [Clostridia bacterium]